MRRFYIPQSEFNIDNIVLNGVEHNHLKNVLRLKENERVVVVCGDGNDYECEIVEINKTSTYLKLIETTKNLYDSHADVTVYQALTKSDNMALIIQKLTELGVKRFVPFESRYVTAKDKSGKTDKLQQISNQSIKQCKRSTPMCVESTLSFKQMVKELKKFDKVVFANECEHTQNLSDIKFSKNEKVALIIGSEGGFSEEEIKEIIVNNGISVSLGRRILRAETASIALTSVVMFLMSEWCYE